MTIGISGFIYYKTAKEELLGQIYNNMEALSEAKKKRLVSLIKNRREQVMLLQIRNVFTEDLVEYLKDKSSDKKIALESALQSTRDKIPSYKKIYLVGTDGKVIVSSSKQAKVTNFSENVSFQHAIKRELCLHDFYTDENNALLMYLSGILVHEGEDVGVIIIETDAEEILSFVQDYTGLGKTGETAVAKKLPSGEIYYITPTRFFPIPGQPLIRPYHPQHTMSYALSGREELLVENFFDYRGEPVIASSRYIPTVGWALTTKIDKKEALAPIRLLLLDILTISVILIASGGVLAYLFSERLTRLILSLCKISREIANGELERRIGYTKKNELGELALSFNLMADKLVDTNRRLIRKVEEMDRINDSLNRFAYVVSHDLKSPLISISMLLNYMRPGIEKSNETEALKMLDMVAYKANHMQELINGILRYSIAANTEEEKELVNLNDLLNEIIRHLQIPANTEILIESLPIIYIERILILQVFQNLVGNSIKYMDKPKGWVKVGCLQLNGYYQFHVIDNARGIEKRHFEKIFDIFNKTNRVEGIDSSGLGLSIVKKIIEAKGGKIWVESNVGEGSSFFFTLPLDKISSNVLV